MLRIWDMNFPRLSQSLRNAKMVWATDSQHLSRISAAPPLPIFPATHWIRPVFTPENISPGPPVGPKSTPENSTMVSSAKIRGMA